MQLTNEVYMWLARHPFPEHPPDLGFIFRLVGLRVGTPESREVYDRLLERIALEREHHEKLHPKANTTPKDLGS